MSSVKSNSDRQTLVSPPAHPVPQLQKPFEESMMESVNNQLDEDVPADAITRRTMLLEAPTYERVIAGRWKQKPGERYHPLWKLVAQMSFGMHLLAKHMAISEEEVMRILQSHVDDIDGFLERTTEDFDLAQSDIHERLRCLKLPLAHGDVFDRMLEDRSFRASILDGNEKIDHVISRTKRAAKDALKDVQKGFDATNVLEKYLTKLDSTWKRESPEHEAVLVAMLGNVEGWRRAFLELHLQGNKLAGSLIKLAEIVSEMERRAAAVSRNIVAKSQRYSQKSGRALSQAASGIDQKPLPSEPGRRLSTRPSSRATQLAQLSTWPNSGRKSGQGLIAYSQSGSGQSPRSSDSRRSVRPNVGEQSFTSPARASGESSVRHVTQRAPDVVDSLREAGNNHPIELPADVPDNILRQAPVSVKNRLSMTLGLKPRDLSEHRVSSIYYPKALGDLLKSSAMSSLRLTPQSSQVKATPVVAVSSPVTVLGGETDHYEESPTLGMITPESKNELQSSRNSHTTRESARASARASVAGSSPATRRSSVPNAAFTSHPVVMAMASPPAELPSNTESDNDSSSKHRKDSNPGSLGEPGPEMAEITTRPTSPSESDSRSGSRSNVGVTLGGDATTPAPAEETSAALLQEDEKPAQLDPDEQANRREGLDEEVVSPAAVTQIPTLEDDRGESGIDLAKEAEEGINVKTVVPRADHTSSEPQSIAELEAFVPEAPNTQPERDPGPVELEAPIQTFRLPPRPLEALRNPEKDVLRASITQLDDFFKLPTEHAIRPGMKPKDFGNSDTPQPIGPLKLKLAKKDGRIVPVQIDGGPEESQHTGIPSSKLRINVVADLIETMSQTPPGSPIHSRSHSSASNNSGQQRSHRSSRSLGPPEQAPAPPGPGGRSMVSPDFAAAGQFEGERKQKKKFRTGSKSGWKSFLGGNANAAESSSASSASPSEHSKGTSRSGVEPVPNADTMTASGKDLAWFRGDTKKAVGVS
ncbi:hypothetical protein A1O3_02621 [Capronia epimyces CBS 606.96]|uniref:Uncharacterized protein n=1 Tax=Capronia epimyces CBS 606.96 TaxID=1182542 RepID=W9Z4Y5_9EURO|nr:uncharacterized protein A1O3_02621 [Capronia epimyces CBS 606.96]EXJ89554.1 hypothetical protein A1O3_02621 [Capronia epimyces CBS 606.96]